MTKVPDLVRKELAALAAKPEGEIDFSDLPATKRKDWQGAERGKFYRPIKQQLTVRVDADVLEWLKSQGSGFLRRMNGILRNARLAPPAKISITLKMNLFWFIMPPCFPSYPQRFMPKRALTHRRSPFEIGLKA